MKIEIKNGTANVFTPYNPDFVKSIKKVGGAIWNQKEKCWCVPEESVNTIREIMVSIYGYSDISTNENVTLRITFEREFSVTHSDVILFGKILSHATGRDSGARVGNDVAFVVGGASSGGSVKNWRSVVDKDSVAVLTNVNKNLYENSKIIEGLSITLIENAENKTKLQEEKARLLKRIAEIDKILNEVLNEN